MIFSSFCLWGLIFSFFLQFQFFLLSKSFTLQVYYSCITKGSVMIFSFFPFHFFLFKLFPFLTRILLKGENLYVCVYMNILILVYGPEDCLTCSLVLNSHKLKNIFIFLFVLLFIVNVFIFLRVCLLNVKVFVLTSIFFYFSWLKYLAEKRVTSFSPV